MGRGASTFGIGPRYTDINGHAIVSENSIRENIIPSVIVLVLLERPPEPSKWCDNVGYGSIIKSPLIRLVYGIQRDLSITD